MLTSRLAAPIVAFAAPLLLYGGALVSQYGFGLHPCEMCYWQRWPHQAAILLALIALLLRRNDKAMRALTLLAALAIAPLIRCDAVQWSLFGISLAGFNAIFSFAAAALVLTLLRRGRTSAT